MKKIFLTFLVVISLFGIAGCSEQYNSNPNKKNDTSAVTDNVSSEKNSEGNTSSSSNQKKSSYPSNIPAPHNITRRAVNHLKENYNIQEVIQKDDAKFVGSNENGYHFISMIKVRLNTGVKVARVNVHFSPDGKTYRCESKLRNPNPDGT